MYKSYDCQDTHSVAESEHHISTDKMNFVECIQNLTNLFAVLPINEYCPNIWLVVFLPLHRLRFAWDVAHKTKFSEVFKVKINFPVTTQSAAQLALLCLSTLAKTNAEITENRVTAPRWTVRVCECDPAKTDPMLNFKFYITHYSYTHAVSWKWIMTVPCTQTHIWRPLLLRATYRVGAIIDLLIARNRGVSSSVSANVNCLLTVVPPTEMDKRPNLLLRNQFQISEECEMIDLRALSQGFPVKWERTDAERKLCYCAGCIHSRQNLACSERSLHWLQRWKAAQYAPCSESLNPTLNFPPPLQLGP